MTASNPTGTLQFDPEKEISAGMGNLDVSLGRDLSWDYYGCALCVGVMLVVNITFLGLCNTDQALVISQARSWKLQTENWKLSIVIRVPIVSVCSSLFSFFHFCCIRVVVAEPSSKHTQASVLSPAQSWCFGKTSLSQTRLTHNSWLILPSIVSLRPPCQATCLSSPLSAPPPPHLPNPEILCV